MSSSSSDSVPTGQWLTSDDGRRWWFDSGSITLDFAYTGALGGSEARERLRQPEDLAHWLSERFPGIEGEVADRDLLDAKGLRAAIGRVATAFSAGSGPREDDVDIVNLFAATPDIPPSLSGGTRQAGRTRARAAQALSALAREAVRLFGGETERIRECAADDCSIVFYDGSRSNNRRWCSMQRCGNRAKVRAHRARLG